MADATQVLTTLEQQRQALVDAYINRAWTMWQSLDPSDWWNDAVTQGVGAWITQNQMAFVKAMRRLGISYADIMLRLVNVPPGRSDTRIRAHPKQHGPLGGERAPCGRLPSYGGP